MVVNFFNEIIYLLKPFRSAYCLNPSVLIDIKSKFYQLLSIKKSLKTKDDKNTKILLINLIFQIII